MKHNCSIIVVLAGTLIAGPALATNGTRVTGFGAVQNAMGGVGVGGQVAPQRIDDRRAADLAHREQGGVAHRWSRVVGGSVQRVQAGSSFPCVVRGTTTLQTYLCELDLPDGAQLDEIIASANDTTATGYYEAAVYRTIYTSVGPNFISVVSHVASGTMPARETARAAEEMPAASPR